MKLSKYAFSTVAAVALALSLIGPAKAGELELAQPGVLTCSTEAAYPPWSYQTVDGQRDGLTIRLMREVSSRLDLKFQYVITKWESVLIGLFAGKYDMTCSTMDITKERQERALFTDGWIESGGIVIVREDSDIKTLADVEGHSLGVLVASTSVELAKPLKPGEVKHYKSDSDNMQDVILGKTDGMITESLAGAFMIKLSGQPLRIVPGFLQRTQKSLVLRKDSVNLAKAINKVVAEMVADGTFAKIANEMLGINPYPEEPIRSIFE
jgi:polar amino acid transport system substrate-binding protein